MAPGEVADAFKQMGWTTATDFAHAAAYPGDGRITTAELREALLAPLFKIGPTDPLPTCAAAFRMLFKFAHAQVAGASGKANHVGEDESPRLLAVE